MRQIDEIEDLLDRERRVILSGDIGELERITERKTRLFASLDFASAHTQAAVQRISSKSRDNGELLSSAGKGIQSALDQVRDARSMFEQTIYGKDGARRSLVTPPSRLEQKY